MALEYRIISIGTMSHNRLWNEQADVRTAHATTTLIKTDEKTILVDPSLPAEILKARLFERTGQGPETVTDVFCTTLHPTQRRGLTLFDQANWYAGETEIQWYAGQLEALNESAERLESDDARSVRGEIDLIGRFESFPDRFGDQVGLYPLHGATPGCSGLLLTPATQTIVIAGPAVPTREHMMRGMVWDGCANADEAMDSLTELLEIADLIVPGFDNVFSSPRRWL